MLASTDQQTPALYLSLGLLVPALWWSLLTRKRESCAFNCSQDT